MPRGRKKGSLNKKGKKVNTALAKVKKSRLKKEVVEKVKSSDFFEEKPVKIKREKKEKKAKLTKAERKGNLLKTKIGDLFGAINILDYSPRYVIVLRYEEKKTKKEKIKKLYSGIDLKYLQDIVNYLGPVMLYPYNAEPVEAKRKSKPKNGFEIDHSLFKSYNGECFIMLVYGSIWLKNGKFVCLSSSEKIDGFKISELYNNKKLKSAHGECAALLETFDDFEKSRLLKEVVHYGDNSDKNSVRVLMNEKPVYPHFDEVTNKIVMSDLILVEEEI